MLIPGDPGAWLCLAWITNFTSPTTAQSSTPHATPQVDVHELSRPRGAVEFSAVSLGTAVKHRE
jgi:hypothetical protein